MVEAVVGVLIGVACLAAIMFVYSYGLSHWWW